MSAATGPQWAMLDGDGRRTVVDLTRAETARMLWVVPDGPGEPEPPLRVAEARRYWRLLIEAGGLLDELGGSR